MKCILSTLVQVVATTRSQLIMSCLLRTADWSFLRTLMVEILNVFIHVIPRVKMNEEIDNDPDFEENSIDPFNSDESEIDDSDHENDSPVEEIVAYYFIKIADISISRL